MADVDHEGRLEDAELHVVDQVGAAGEEHGVGTVGDGGDRVGDAGGAVVGERDHRAASLMAATMLG